MNYIYATGKRKKSIARLWIKLDNEFTKEIQEDQVLSLEERLSLPVDFTINRKYKMKEYFKEATQQDDIFKPLNLLKIKKCTIKCTVKGGGKSGQMGAIRLALSRALNNESNHTLLKNSGLLTRDSRKNERHHYGRLKARKSVPYNRR